MTIREAINETLLQMYETGRNLRCGCAFKKPSEVSDADLAAGIERHIGWKLSPQTIKAFRG